MAVCADVYREDLAGEGTRFGEIRPTPFPTAAGCLESAEALTRGRDDQETAMPEIDLSELTQGGDGSPNLRA
ncbi:hypothetical protein GCM10009642_08230 [Nocardiopsis metallicus]